MTASSVKSSRITLPDLLLFLAFIVFAIYLRAAFFVVSIENLPVNTDEALNMLMAADISRGNFPLLFWTQPYQFPLEAYFLSLFQTLLPPDAFGARFLLGGVAGLSFVGFSSILLLCSQSLRKCWPGLLLVAVPSAYVIVRQTGLVIPQYTSSVTFAWLLPLLFVVSRCSDHKNVWGIALGIASGLAISIHLLTLSIVFATAAVYCWGRSFSDATKNTTRYLLGLSLGLLPYFLVLGQPDAYSDVTGTISISQAIGRLWGRILTRIAPATLGVNPPIFPDHGFETGPFPELILPFALFLVALLLLGVIFRARRLFILLREKKWPALEMQDLFLMVGILSILLAAFAKFGVKYRYLLPLAWAFPFIVTTVFERITRKPFRYGLGVVVLTLAALNVYNADRLMKQWSKPHFADGIPNMPSLDPLVMYLNENSITHCYASWWLTYRIPFETQEAINCAQPFNERFPGWELPESKRAVDRAQQSPYIILSGDRGVFSPKQFERTVRQQHIRFDRKKLRGFLVYRNFRHVSGSGSQKILSEDIAISASSNRSAASALTNGDVSDYWHPTSPLSDSWIELSFPEARLIQLLRVYDYAKKFRADTHPLRISVFDGANWQVVVERSHGLQHKTKIGHQGESSHFSGTELTFGFPAIRAEKIRIETVYEDSSKEKPGKAVWRLAEIEVFEQRNE